MRRLLCLGALVLLASPLEGAKRTKANTLSNKEIAEGWILLFDGETPFGWTTSSKPAVKKGTLRIGDKKPSSAMTSAAFQDFDLRFDYRSEREGKDMPHLRLGGTKSLQLFGRKSEWGHLHVKFGRKRIDGEFGDGKALSFGRGTDPDLVPIRFEVPAECFLSLRNIKLKPLGLKSIFNGKDLTGWKEISDKKSKFSVTDKGELNIKDGPGDIQTESQWADFVLQLDVISHGKHLNSGVFFRCLPGQFWSGYEAQIRNQWAGDDRTKPVDYGTGGIYNRQPARKVVSSDKEWFTMTIVANGKHLAVWVNGYQTADFTDMRKPDKSARNGSKVDKGPISLQGHDKTTNLSFRNIRIAELPSAKQ